MASLADVSRQAGVSIATASRVLNGSTHPVSPATRARVLAAAAALSYTPSPVAQALVRRSSRIIGVIVGSVIDPYFAEIARGVSDVANEHGYLTMLCNSDMRAAHEVAHLRTLAGYRAEGIVFAGSGAADTPEAAELAASVEQAREQGIPVVALAVRDFAAPLIAVDNRKACAAITEHVANLGHRRITHIVGPERLYTSRLRVEGFRDAMAARGLPADDLEPGGFDYDAGYAAAQRILVRPELPDAVVAANDEAAIGVLMAFQEAGVDVPDGVSVAGIDDTRSARFVGLTTVAVPLYEMGRTAARRIVERDLEGTGWTVLAHRVVVRSTTAARGVGRG